MWNVQELSEGKYAVSNGRVTLTFIRSEAVLGAPPTCIMYAKGGNFIKIETLNVMDRRDFHSYEKAAIEALEKYIAHKKKVAT